MSHGVAALAQVCHVVGVEVGERRANALVEPCFADEMAVRFGRDGKSIRHFNSLAGEFADHLAERCVLSADQRDIGNRDVGEPFDEGVGL